MNFIARGFDALTDFIFGPDPLKTIQRRQNDIRVINARAQEKTTMAAIDIEDAVDDQIDAIRAAVAAGFARIEPLLGTGAVEGKSAAALKKARDRIENALVELDAAI